VQKSPSEGELHASRMPFSFLTTGSASPASTI
jgi:hypothetical protein